MKRNRLRPTASVPLLERLSAEEVDTLSRLEAAGLDVIESRYWRTGPEWSIPSRALDNTWYVVLLHGSVTLSLGGIAESLNVKAGHLLIVPRQTQHTVTYCGTCRSTELISIHAHWLDVRRRDIAPSIEPLVQSLGHWQHWRAAFLDACSLFSHQPSTGRRLAEHLLHSVMVQQVRSGRMRLRTSAAELDPRIAEALAFAVANSADPIGVPELAKRAGVSEVRLRQLFKAELGMPPHAFLMGCRLDEAARRLRQTNAPIREIAEATGFASEQHLHT